jgi:small conductance mechanosensitive channel
MQMVGNDGVRIIMPNSKVWGAKIINYSLSERRRIELIIKVPDDKTNQALIIIDSVLNLDERVMRDPTPSTQIISISDKAATLRVWAWTKPESHQSAVGDIYLRLSTSLSEEGVPLM